MVEPNLTTEKLFWINPYQREFSAQILDQSKIEQGYAIVLDRTCFYATSGGQPNDLGTLNSVSVSDVRIQEGRLIHLLSSPLENETVTGIIDWKRRFNYMQQHTGQHILSAAFFKLFAAETSSFHLGEEFCTIELSKRDLTEDQLQLAEQTANSILLAATPVKAFFIDADKAEQYALRKKSDLAESLRIIQIGDFDLSPCSGTHVQNTAEVGVIFIYGHERLSATHKVTFLCGDRIRKKYSSDLSVLKTLSKNLTTSFELLPDAVGRLQSQVKDLRKESMRLKEASLQSEALKISETAPVREGKRLIVTVWKRPYQEVRYLAQKLSELPHHYGALASSSENRLIFFKHPKAEVDLRSLFDEFLAATTAKGGGPPHFLEAGIPQTVQNIDELLSRIFES